jgi:UDP-N-acetylmuramoyl-L-alanine---L-glutamate ligase
MFGDFFRLTFEGRRIAILGFGLEGRSTYRHIRKLWPGMHLNICDRNRNVSQSDEYKFACPGDSWFLGDDYLKGLENADIIVKSPGISFKELQGVSKARMTSQTELFLNVFREQVVGITGTKGKSTTSSLLYHILIAADKHALLAGNIGTPCFELLDKINEDTIIVFEMSSHQLENIEVSPHIAILLNIFREHLDHYDSYDAYKEAKMNIARWQKEGDLLFYNSDNHEADKLVSGLMIDTTLFPMRLSPGKGNGVWYDDADLLLSGNGLHRCFPDIANRRLLPGVHNLLNISAAAGAAALLDVPDEIITDSVAAFRGLPHRMEYVGTFDGVNYYNDSIATIPEAAMEALKSLPDTSVLILGGKDRGLHYEALIDFLAAGQLEIILFTGETASRMHKLTKDHPGFKSKECMLANSFEDAVKLACRMAPAGSTVLLSPAAASYDMFRDFKERGERFKELVRLYA